jgi:predicted metallo-beta-lactamase superfamily hydrolase
MARACSVIVDGEPSPAERMRRARLVVQEATAIIDGEVIRAEDGDRPALVRAVHVLKGPGKAVFQVGGRGDSCDLYLDAVGERRRLILIGGPETYFVTLDGSNAAYEDRLLRSDRRKVWPFREGHPLKP